MDKNNHNNHQNTAELMAPELLQTLVYAQVVCHDVHKSFACFNVLIPRY